MSQTASWLDGIGAHLTARYGVDVSGVTALDRGVARVERRDGAAWVARVFPAERPREQVDGDATILRSLERAGFPAERCADAEPVSAWEDQHVLVTGFVDGEQTRGRGRTYAILGALLGRLHARPADGLRAGGAWHHLTFGGGPRAEIDGALALLSDRHDAGVDRLRDAVAGTDDCADLPQSFVHPDFVPPNAITRPDDSLVIIDWTNAGRGPRLWSLGFLLWAAGARDLRLVDAVVSRYGQHVHLDPAELDRLADAIRARPLMLETWGYVNGRRRLPEVLAGIDVDRALATSIAERAREAFVAPGP